MIYNRQITVMSAALVLVASLAACSSQSASTIGPSSAPKHITFISGAIGNDFYTSMSCGIKAEAKKYNYVVDITGPASFDASLQTPIVDSVTAKHPDAVLIAPDDPIAMVGSIRNMKNAGIPVALVDTTLKDTSVAFTQISSDNVQVGMMAAQAINTLVGGSGSVLVLSLNPGISTDAQRVQGFETKLKEYSGIHYVGVQYTQDDPTKAASIVASVLAAHPDLGAIFAVDNLNATGAVTGLRNAHATSQVKVVGVGAAAKQIEDLKSGALAAIIAQSPYLIGQTGVDFIAKKLSGQTVPSSYTTPLGIVTLKNLNDPQTRQKFIYQTSC